MPIFPSLQYFNSAIPPYHFLGGLLYLLTRHRVVNLLKSLIKILISCPSNRFLLIIFVSNSNNLNSTGIVAYILLRIISHIDIWSFSTGAFCRLARRHQRLRPRFPIRIYEGHGSYLDIRLQNSKNND